MGSFLLIVFTAALVLLSFFVVLIILMQRPSANAGLGSALAGGAAESALGGQASNVLTKLTIYCTAIFFVVAFGLYLGYMGRASSQGSAENEALALPASLLEAPAENTVPDLTAVPADAAVPAKAPAQQ